jgi:hypothetical protein
MMLQEDRRRWEWKGVSGDGRGPVIRKSKRILGSDKLQIAGKNETPNILGVALI